MIRVCYFLDGTWGVMELRDARIDTQEKANELYDCLWDSRMVEEKIEPPPEPFYPC